MMNNLTEKKRLIAELMEYPDLGTKGDFSYLKYDSLWGWLMPVIAKIKETETKYSFGLFDDHEDLAHELEDAMWKNDVESAFRIVVELVTIIRNRHLAKLGVIISFNTETEKMEFQRIDDPENHKEEMGYNFNIPHLDNDDIAKEVAKSNGFYLP